MIRWLGLPSGTVDLLNNSSFARRAVVAIVARILDGGDISQASAAGSGPDFKFALSVHGNFLVVGAWQREDVRTQSLEQLAITSLFVSDDMLEDGSIWNYNDDEVAELLERLCQLAVHVWNRLNIPDVWHQNSNGGIHSVFAAGRNLLNIRLPYVVREVGESSLIVCGSTYRFSRKQQKEISVLVPEEHELRSLPSAVVPPIPLVNSEEIKSPSSVLSDSDVSVSLSRVSRHDLFSLKYFDWVRTDGPLTQQQRRIITHPVDRPLRIHGPAGSGKTLVLVLKALSLLIQNQKDDHPCRVLFVVTSEAVAQTVRRMFEVVDDFGFAATTPSDRQFLEVDTLHGWCLKKTNLQHKAKYVLQRDPLHSKELQHLKLGLALRRVLDKSFDNLRSQLSDDFVRLVHHARSSADGWDSLVSDMQSEISVRIKGVGYRVGSREKYVNSSLECFVGRRATRYDRYMIFSVFESYESELQVDKLLDTDDVVLSTSAVLSSPQWDRMRVDEGFHYVLVDETHLFNENERRLLPLLTCNSSGYLPIIMTFDEAQSVGGKRGGDLSDVGIKDSKVRNLSVVHRCSPEILRLARDIVERTDLVFSEFRTAEPVSGLSAREQKLARAPQLRLKMGDERVVEEALKLVGQFYLAIYKRIGVICFSDSQIVLVQTRAAEMGMSIRVVTERGSIVGSLPSEGVYLMSADACGGLEFDCVLLLGVDRNRVPPADAGMSSDGYLFRVSESYKLVYTAVTRARYSLVFICDEIRGASEIVRASEIAGLVQQVE